jgi:hypothetical protein
MSEKSSDLFYKEMELIEKRIMLNKLIQLNLSLYTAILNYAKNNGIPIAFDATILRLTQQIEKVDTETFPLTDEEKYPNNNRRFLTNNFKRNKTDGDLTEPKSAILIKFTERLHVATS